MNSFCIDTIRTGPHWRAQHGVLRADGLALTTDARRAADLLQQQAQRKSDLLLKQAQRKADALLAQARAAAVAARADAQAEAERTLSRAHDEALALTTNEQQQVLAQAAQLLQALEQANATFLDRAEDLVVDLTRTLFDRLAMHTPPREQLAAALQRVVQEAPPKLVEAVLKAHPDDIPLLPELDWPVKPDSSLARGACRLEASSGQWCADFNAAVEAVRSAFLHSVEEARMRQIEDNGGAAPGGIEAPQAPQAPQAPEVSQVVEHEADAS